MVNALARLDEALLDEPQTARYRDASEVGVSQAFSKRRVLVAWPGVLLAVLVAALLSSGCGDDEDDAPAGEPCPQAGGLDDGCICSSDRPPGIRRCLDTGVWGACACGEPIMQPCETGDPVECMCPGESAPRITECLGAGTFDCGCDDSRGAAGDGE